MRRQTLPEFEFVLTPSEQSLAAFGTAVLERNRRQQNERDRRAEREADARLLERALEPFE